MKFIISKNICFKFFLLFYSISLLFPNLDDNIKLLTFTDGLSSNNMTEFMIDRSNRIWIGTYNGLSIYDGTGFYNFFNHDSISSKNINTFYNYENNVWFGTSDGIFNINLDLKIKKVKSYVSDHHGIEDIIIDKTNLYAISKNKLLIYDLDSKNYREIDFKGAKSMLINDVNLIISTKNKLFSYNLDNNKKSELIVINSKINCMSLNDDILYLGTSDGLYKYKLNNSTMDIIKKYFDGKNIEAFDQSHDGKNLYLSVNNSLFQISNDIILSLNHNFKKIKTISVTDNDILFIGSFGEGIFQIDLNRINNYNNFNQIKNLTIKKSLKINNDIIFSTNEGLFSTNRDKFIFKGHIFDFTIDDLSNFWLATKKGLVKFSNQVSTNVNLNTINSKSPILSINLDKMNRKWMGTLNGLIMLDSKKNEEAIYNKSDGLISNIIYSTCQVPKGIVATGNNGISYLKNYKNIKTYNLTSDEYSSCAYDYDLDLLWISTSNSGIKLFDLDSGEVIKSYTTSNGLSNNEVYSLNIDHENNLWVSTDGGGVSMFNGEFWINLDSYDGLISNTIFDVRQISKNEYLVSGDLGYSIYTKRNNKPFFNISNVKGAKLKNQEYTVPLNSSIYIQLKPIDYITNPNKFSYRYRDSSNYEWIYFRTNSEIEYNCKNSDVSQLEIQYIDRDGNISDSEFVNLNILKPWYIRLEIVVPLYGSIFILLITTIYAFYIYFKKRKHVDFLKEKEIIRQREELEKARAFQINMLPENSPSFFNFDIATHISTADEVGGDYYDFFEIEKKNELVAVLGDATGHGMIAGNVVSITKAGLNSVDFNKPINQVLQNINQILKKVGIGRNRMCLNICHLNEHSFEICSAGMPPTYIYKKSANSINELIISGLPAGSLYKNKYESKNFTFENGDVIVMLSDGLPECENVNGEILGYDRVKETILSSVDKNAENIKDDLINLGKNWLNDIKTKDDITFMVIKKS